MTTSTSTSTKTSTSTRGDKICVCVRKRCLNPKEVLRMEHDAVTCLHPTATVHSARLRVDGISKYCDHNTFEFDHAFDECSSTEDVYRHAAWPLVNYVCAGGAAGSNCNGVPRGTVFAYGQTGSGKTYTMGGIQRMVAEDIFSILAGNGNKIGFSSEDTAVSIAIFEIYGGRIQDLLNNRNRLKVLEDGRGEVVVSGLEEFAVSNPREFLSLIERGHDNRTTHATEANDVSSRSHAICQILFRDKNNNAGRRLKGKLSLVDLAGSERGNDTKSHDRQRRTESSDINTSLLALKECIRAIDGGNGHVPYRQSKLTLILKDCFVSKLARTAMIATLSPGSNSTDHTVNTLRYADRIKEKKVR
jgi:kinesin family protein 2/24